MILLPFRMNLFISTEGMSPPCFYGSPEWTNQTPAPEEELSYFPLGAGGLRFWYCETRGIHLVTSS